MQWLGLRERAGEIKEQILRRLMPSRMNLYPFSWPLLPETCPCDVDFCDYLQERRITGRSLFHFGTGGHHLVGTRNRDDGLGNHVLGITASPAEMAVYTRRAIRDATWADRYRVLFADIYNLHGSTLPVFELATLFHLCEYTPPDSQRRRLDDAGVLDLVLGRVASGGRVFFYARSFAAARARPLIERAVDQGRLAFEEAYRSLLVYVRA